MILHGIAGLIKDYMDLEDNQVWLKNQKAPLPTSHTLAVNIGFMSLKGMGTSSRSAVTTVGTSITTDETTGTSMYGNVSIDIQGNTFDVITRHVEIVQALNTIAAKELQLANGYMIASNPLSVNDLSGLDGASIPYRFQYVFAVQFFQARTKSLTDYYSVFTLDTTLEDS